MSTPARGFWELGRGWGAHGSEKAAEAWEEEEAWQVGSASRPADMQGPALSPALSPAPTQLPVSKPLGSARWARTGTGHLLQAGPWAEPSGTLSLTAQAACPQSQPYPSSAPETDKPKPITFTNQSNHCEVGETHTH